MARHRLSRDQVIWSFGPDLQPVLEVDPGDVVTFETNDCFSGQIRSEDDLVTEIDLGRINSATGPVGLRGAEPGGARLRATRDPTRPHGSAAKTDSGDKSPHSIVSRARPSSRRRLLRGRF